MSDTGILEDGRNVADLKVVELRDELGKRGLSKSGNKKELADRLRGYLTNGTGEVSEKSASNSPVKSPVNSLIAQYRSTQQQLLKDAQKEPEALEENKEEDTLQNTQDEVVENGHKEADIPSQPYITTEEKVEPYALEQSFAKEEKTEAEAAKEEKDTSTMEDERQPTPPKEVSPVKEETEQEEKVQLPSENDLKSLEEQIPKAVSPIADRKRSETPEREIVPPQNAKEQEVITESPQKDTIDRAISEEPADEEEREPTPQRKNVQPVSGGESDNKSRSSTPKSQSSDSKNQHQDNLNGDDDKQHSTNEVVDEKVHSNVDGDKRKSEVYTEGIVYVKEENVIPKRKLSVIPQKDEDLTVDGLIRHKSVSPPRNPPSNYIYIHGLRRPFTFAQFYAVLDKFGTFDKEDDTWTDNLRSQSIIKYATVEEAQKARDGLHHVVWPDKNNSELLVDFTDEEEFIQQKGIIKKVIKPENDVFAKEKSPSPMQDDLPSPKEVAVKRERLDTAEDNDEGPSRKKKKDAKSLEELFKRTTAQPSLYYLPLSDEEVARKQVQKAIEKRGIKEASVEPLPLPLPVEATTSSSSKRREKSPSPLPIRRRSRSPLRRNDKVSPRPRRSPPRKSSPPRRNRDGPPPPRRQRSPRRSRSPPSKRRSPSPRRSPPSSRKPAATTSASSPSLKKTTTSPPPQRRRSPSPRRR